MLGTEKPLVIDTMGATWYRSVPGAIGLDFQGFARGTFTDAIQKRLKQKLHALTGDDMAKPIVTMGFNVASFMGWAQVGATLLVPQRVQPPSPSTFPMLRRR
jgi:hypothetical protein